jgi:hypothetical protein
MYTFTSAGVELILPILSNVHCVGSFEINRLGSRQKKADQKNQRNDCAEDCNDRDCNTHVSLVALGHD